MFLRAECMVRTLALLVREHVITVKTQEIKALPMGTAFLKTSLRFQKCWVNGHL